MLFTPYLLTRAGWCWDHPALFLSAFFCCNDILIWYDGLSHSDIKESDMKKRYRSYEDYIRPKWPKKIVIERTVKRSGDAVLVSSCKPVEIVR